MTGRLRGVILATVEHMRAAIREPRINRDTLELLAQDFHGVADQMPDGTTVRELTAAPEFCVERTHAIEFEDEGVVRIVLDSVGGSKSWYKWFRLHLIAGQRTWVHMPYSGEIQQETLDLLATLVPISELAQAHLLGGSTQVRILLAKSRFRRSLKVIHYRTRDGALWRLSLATTEVSTLVKAVWIDNAWVQVTAGVTLEDLDAIGALADPGKEGS